MTSILWLRLAMLAIGVGWLAAGVILVSWFRRASAAGAKRPWGNLAIVCFFLWTGGGIIYNARSPVPLGLVGGSWAWVCASAGGLVAVLVIMLFEGRQAATAAR